MKEIPLSALRQKLGFSQSELAQLLGWHPMTVSKIERGLLEIDPWRNALLSAFNNACARKPATGERARQLLRARGVVAALRELLNES